MKIKKNIGRRTACVLAGLSMLMTAAPVFAQISAETEVNIGTAEVTVAGICTPGSYVNLAVFPAGASASPEHCQYVSQITGDVDGTFAFVFSMSNDAVSGDYIALVSSADEDEVIIENFTYISLSSLLSGIKETQSAEEVRTLLERNNELLQLDLTKAVAAVTERLKGREFETAAELCREYEKLVILYEFSKAENAGAMAELYETSAAVFGTPPEGYDLSDKEYVFNVLSNADYDMADIDRIKDLVKAGVTLAFIRDGKALDVDKAVTLVKDNAEVLGVSDLINGYSENVLQIKVKNLFGKSITKIDKFYDELNNASDGQNTNNGNSGGNGGGGGANRYSGTGSGNGIPVITLDKSAAQNEMKEFSDLLGVEWAEEAIYSLCSRGILSGVGDGKFLPNNDVTREEFVKMLVLATALYDAEAKSSFDDVTASDWFYTYIASAEKYGIVLGGGDGRFGTGSLITRQDMAVMLCRAMEIARVSGGNAVDKVFTDRADIAEYANSAVEKMTSAGIINGFDDGTFKPLNNATRAEAAKMIYEAVNLKEGAV